MSYVYLPGGTSSANLPSAPVASGARSAWSRYVAMAPPIGSVLFVSWTNPVTWPWLGALSTGFSTSLVCTTGGRSLVSTAQPAPRYRVHGGTGDSSSMKLLVPLVPMSTAASRLNPRFHGRNRPPMVSVEGMVCWFARQRSWLGLFTLQG